MSLFSGFLKGRNNAKKEHGDYSKKDANAHNIATAATTNQDSSNKQVTDKETGVKCLTDERLLSIFSEYFAPNTDFYDQPGSTKFKAYFEAINAAKAEMLNTPTLYKRATHREPAELLEMLNKPVPGYTNSIVCALIFSVGKYAVIKSAVLCVDFSELIPNCIALYLLLTAQKIPSEKRIQTIDAGEGTDTQPLLKALDALSVCDAEWKCRIY